MANKAEEDTSMGEFIEFVADPLVFGAGGGSVYHFFKGMYNSPSGHRFIGATRALRNNAPRIAKGTAVYGGLYCTIGMAMEYLLPETTPTEDIWCELIWGASVGGLANVRQGYRRASKMALLFGGAFAGIKILGEKAKQHLEMSERAKAEGRGQPQE
ncbi:unnamed protein product [Rhodiola kirilowii]